MNAILSLHLLVLLVTLYPFRVLGARNITVDDTDNSIRYSGKWESTGEDPLNVGDSHHFTDNTHAFAEFNFSGTAVYLMSPQWPYQVGVQVSIDDSAPSSVSLKDPNNTKKSGGPETVNSSVVWSSGELTNGTHLLTVSFLPGMDYAALDAILYTTSDNTDSGSDGTSPSSSSTTSSTAPNETFPTSTSTPSHSHEVLLIVGSAVGSLLGIIIVVALFAIWIYRRQRRQKQRSQRTGMLLPVPVSSRRQSESPRQISPFILTESSSRTGNKEKGRGINVSDSIEIEDVTGITVNEYQRHSSDDGLLPGGTFEDDQRSSSDIRNDHGDVSLVPIPGRSLQSPSLRRTHRTVRHEDSGIRIMGRERNAEGENVQESDCIVDLPPEYASI